MKQYQTSILLDSVPNCSAYISCLGYRSLCIDWQPLRHVGIWRRRPFKRHRGYPGTIADNGETCEGRSVCARGGDIACTVDFISRCLHK